MRETIDALKPEGAIWNPAYSGDFDRLLDGIALNKQVVLDDLGIPEHIRNPYLCPFELLPDLEREFGITPNSAFPENERRMSLAAIRYRKHRYKSLQKLQYILNVAGFGYGGYGLIVTQNSPPVNPSNIMFSYKMTAHEFPSIYCAGNRVANCSEKSKGYYLVAEIIEGAEEIYQTPPEAYWPLVFFVGGSVSRDYDGNIEHINFVEVPAYRKQELHRLILRTVSLGIWAALFIEYT
jgi:hypothetical protein